MAVPYYDFVDDRNQLNDSATAKGQEKTEQYWKDKNQLSIDGSPTHILYE